MEIKSGRISENSALMRVAKRIIAEAAHKTWLAELLRQRPDWLANLAAWLRKLTRNERRALQHKLASGALIAALMCSILGVHPARAANITVDGTTCTLASAISSANSNSSVGGCTAGSGADTINLIVDVTLTADLPKITSNITIQGGGHFVSGNNTNRVFWVGSTIPGNLTLDNVWVKDGYGGYGAGLYMYGGSTVTVKNCTISGNSTPDGSAAISVQDTNLTIQNSTITGNTTLNNGGGSAIKTWNNAVVSIQNSTISGNSTFGGQGAVYFAYGTSVTIENSIIANQTSGTDCSEGAGKNIATAGHNIESGTSCGFTNAAQGDMQNVTAGNLKLQALSSSGVGMTPTMALGSYSLALEQIPVGAKCGAGSPYNLDQRGKPRPGDKNTANKCEIGAWEAQTTDLTLAVALQSLKASAGLGWLGTGWAAVAAIGAAFGALLWRRRSPKNG